MGIKQSSVDSAGCLISTSDRISKCMEETEAVKSQLQSLTVKCVVCVELREMCLVDGAVSLKQAWKKKTSLMRESWKSSLTFLGLASHTFVNPEVRFYLFVYVFVADAHAWLFTA